CIVRCQPPFSALFPYTTLFRSGRSSCYTDSRKVGGERGRGPCCLDGLIHFHGCISQGKPLGYCEECFVGFGLFSFKCLGQSCQGDRKSTRLNSSHVKISYAVFC